MPGAPSSEHCSFSSALNAQRREFYDGAQQPPRSVVQAGGAMELSENLAPHNDGFILSSLVISFMQHESESVRFQKHELLVVQLCQ